MNNKTVHNILVFLIAAAIIASPSLMASLPWWSFVIPLFILGIVTRFLKWNIPGFSLGFLAGFAIWFGVNWYLDSHSGNIVLSRIGQILGQNKWVVLLVAGTIGGILGGLALSSGEQLFAESRSKKLPVLEQQSEETPPIKG
jgi:hypothetical protein